LTLKRKKKMSTITPYKRVKMKLKGRKEGRQRPVSTPPKAPTCVAPMFFMNRAPRASKTASTTINNLSIGGGTKTLVTNIIEPKSAAINNRLAFCTVAHPFQIKARFNLKNLDITNAK
jgi:hypothetical protein